MRLDNFRTIDRETAYLLPPSVDEWLPERHLARFIVEVIDRLDLSAMSRSYRGTGSASYHPTLLLGLLVYGYATALSQGDREAVRAGAGAGARDGDAQDGHRCTGRHQDPRQRQPAQRVVVRARRQDRGAIEGGSGRVVGAGGSRGQSGCARRHVDSRGIGTPREALGEAC